ncbi:MAG: hypothetical protein ACEQSA_03820 [Weeksellaceae bacterium]
MNITIDNYTISVLVVILFILTRVAQLIYQWQQFSKHHPSARRAQLV